MEATSSSEPNSDYLYNRATYDLLTGINSRSMLQEARRVCQEDDDDEAAAIDVQLEGMEFAMEWTRLPKKQIKDKDLPQAVKTVRDVNRATSDCISCSKMSKQLDRLATALVSCTSVPFCNSKHVSTRNVPRRVNYSSRV